MTDRVYFQQGRVKESCDRCCGTGTWSHPGMAAGVCFKCGGKGKVMVPVMPPLTRKQQDAILDCALQSPVFSVDESDTTFPGHFRLRMTYTLPTGKQRTKTILQVSKFWTWAMAEAEAKAEAAKKLLAMQVEA